MNNYLKNRYAKYIITLEDDFSYYSSTMIDFIDEIIDEFELKIETVSSKIPMNAEKKVKADAVKNPFSIIKNLPVN